MSETPVTVTVNGVEIAETDIQTELQHHPLPDPAQARQAAVEHDQPVHAIENQPAFGRPGEPQGAADAAAAAAKASLPAGATQRSAPAYSSNVGTRHCAARSHTSAPLSTSQRTSRGVTRLCTIGSSM